MGSEKAKAAATSGQIGAKFACQLGYWESGGYRILAISRYILYPLISSNKRGLKTSRRYIYLELL